MTRPLAGLLLAQAVSIAGTRMSMVALPWFVLVTTGSPVRMGLVAFAEMLPYVVCSVLAAPIVDRVGARRASMACDLASAVAVALVPLLHRTGGLSFPLLLALVATAGALRGPGDNAKHVLLPAIAERASMPLERAAGLYDGVNRAAGLLGAPLAGVLVSVLGPAEVLFADAATFLVAALVVLTLVRVPAATPPAAVENGPGGYVHRLGEGMRFLVGDRLLLAIALMLGVTNLLDQAWFNVLLPLWSAEEGHGALGVGLTGGVFGLGATVGALVLASVGARLPRRVTFLAAFLLAGAPRFLAAALGAPLGVLLAVAAVGGLAAGALNPLLAVVELERIPERLRARVLSASTAIAYAGIPVGGLVGGWLVAVGGLRAALAVTGVAYLLATLVPLGRTWRGMDRSPGQPEPAST